MSLIVEDGTGVADADSYQAVVDARALAVLYGISLPVDDTDVEVSLRKSYLHLNTLESQLQGNRTHTIQTGIFPRSNVYVNCNLLDSEEIPKDVLLAQLYASEAIESGATTNAIDTGEKLAGFDVKGVYSETYQDNSSIKLNATIQGVNNSLSGYMKSATSSSNQVYRDEY